MPENEGQAPGQSAGAENQQNANQGQQQGQAAPQNQEIDWSKVDVNSLPESVVKQHPAFKKVLSESVERRQQIKGLRDQIDAMEQGETPATQQKPTPNNTDENVPAWARDLQAQFAELKTASSESLRQDMVANAIKKHNLPKEAATYINASTPEQIEAQAAGLVPLMVNAGGSSGNPGGGNAFVDTARTRMWEKIKGNATAIAATSPFDPGVQRAKGGGGFFVSKEE